MLASPTPDTWLLKKFDSLWLKMSLICLSWLPYTAEPVRNSTVFPTESSTLMGKGRKLLTCLYCDWFALILTGLSFLWVFLSLPRKFLYTISNYRRIFEDDTQFGTTSYLTVLYMWMFRLCHFAEFHQLLLLVNQFKVIYIILLSELGGIKIILRGVHSVGSKRFTAI